MILFCQKRLIIAALSIFILIVSNSIVSASSNTKSLEDVFIDRICDLQDFGLDEEQFVKEFVELLFHLKRSYIKGEVTDEFTHYIFGDFQDNKSIRGFINKMRYDKEKLKYANYKILWDNISIDFFNITFDNDKVIVDLQEIYKDILQNYSYGISIDAPRYSIQLQKIENKWLITNIESPDEIDTTFMEDDFNLEEALDWIKNEKPNQSNENIEKYKKVKEFEEKIQSGDYSILANKKFTSYNRTRAQKYMESYGGSKRNSKFFDYSKQGGDCQNFASQCLWYGFGGTDSKSTIEAKAFPMITNSGDRDWYQTSKQNDTPKSWVWTGVDEFFEYIEEGSGFDLGPHGTVYDGVAYAEVGDIIQIDIESDGEFNHSYVVYRVQGTTGSRTSHDIWVTSHTADIHNILLYDRINTLDNCELRTINITGHWGPDSYVNPTE